GRPERGYTTFGLAMGALADAHWSALTPSRPLRRFRLVELAPGQGISSAPVRASERVLHYLAGVNSLDSALEPMLEARALPEWIAEDHKPVTAQAAQVFEAYADGTPLLHLCGDDSHGQEDIAAWVAHFAGRELFVLSAEDLPSAGAELQQIALLWERE